ncbi:MAG: glycosyltransferase [Armatimonadota bacterium]
MADLRVLHLINHTSPVETGYTVRTNAVLSGLSDLGIHVSAVTPPTFLTSLPAQVRRGIRPHRLIAGVPHMHHVRGPLTSAVLAALKAMGRVRGTWRLRTMLEQAEAARFYQRTAVPGYDVFHAHSPYPNAFYAAMLARDRSSPWIYEVRGMWEESDAACGAIAPQDYRTRRDAETEAAMLADRVVVISNGLRRELANRGVPESKVHVIPNGVDTARFRPLPRDDELARQLGISGRTVLGYVSLLRRLEGVDTLVLASAALAQRRNDTACLVVGDGPDLARLQALARGLDSRCRIVFTGRVPHSQIMRYYSLIDVFVVPRIRAKVCETVTPLKPLEAMCMSKAVVVSDVGGLTELVTDGVTGLTFEAGSPEALAACCEALIRNPELRQELGRRARGWVISERDWRQVVRAYPEVYQLALQHRPGASGRAALAT